ncbi:MAG TPA: LysR family transcriptional regulator [Candidatus Flavonifractor merdigallinarum]|uniref:LysR family transcriptional regulator n=1 Tax=Candidatus Flavonifractor merdigallinarum TaxID=2838589 RepID=A0A9D2BYJ0_9FIRM|nr:LysR family transcriptional regulator [Candidatus Flavonifractor merdigallinarum]
MLDSRLHTFLTLCQTMNYTRAAERLCITQPAVTHQIRALEEHYGCRLFSYQGKTLSLTPKGEKLRELARSLAYNSQKIEAALSAAAPVSLRVGATKTIGEFVIAPLVERFLRQHPDAAFSLMVENTQFLLNALEEGKLDFALVEGFFDREKYQSTLLRREAFFGVCAPNHPLAGRAVSLDELAGERLLLREAGSGTRAILEAVLMRNHRSLESFARVTELSDFSTLKTLAAHGLGVSFLYAPVVERELAEGTLVRFDLEGEPLSGAFHFVCLKDNLFAEEWRDWMG